MLSLIPPSLSSRPGAPVTVHIDFDGTPALQFTSTLWASGPAMGNNDPIPAFSIDANVNDFSQAELDGMTAIWQHVAEKFSPFNINVTTIAPPNYNNRVAVQLVVGGSDNDWYNEDAGGVALYNAFTTSAVNAGFVFSADGIDAGSVTLSDDDRHFIAESATHEAGHLFGLHHQSVIDASNNVVDPYSDGDVNTAPIMGGSSNNPGKRGTWNTGPASMKNAAGNHVYVGQQPDLSWLTLPDNMITYRPDDFGDSSSFGGSLNVNSQTGVATAAGVIETNGDQDAFVFNAIGLVLQFTVSNATLGGMLAPTLELYPVEAGGGSPTVTVTTTNTSATLSTTTAFPGVAYILRVSPQGNAYGNLGQYTITGNVGSFSDFARLSGGQLTIFGYDTKNDLGINYIPSTDSIVVQDDVFGRSAIEMYPRSLVSSIVVEFRERNRDDTIQLYGALSTLSIPVTINAGAGSDTLILEGTGGADFQGLVDTFHGYNNATQFTFSSIENWIMTAFAGIDTFEISALSFGSSLTINGGAGGDNIKLAPNDPFGVSTVNGPVTINGEGGADNLHVGSGGLHALHGLVTYSAGSIDEGNALYLYDNANGQFCDYTISETSITRTNGFFFGGVNYSGVDHIALQCTQSPNTVHVTARDVKTVDVSGNGGDDNVILDVANGNFGGIRNTFFGGGDDGVDTLTLDDSLSTDNLSWQILGDDAKTVLRGAAYYFTAFYENVEIRAGSGASQITLNGTLTQGLNIDAGSGNDTIIFNGTNFRAPATINGGNGGDAFNWNAANNWHGARFPDEVVYDVQLFGGSDGNIDVLSILDSVRGFALYNIDEGRMRGIDDLLTAFDLRYTGFESVNLTGSNFDNSFIISGTPASIPVTHQMTIFGGPSADSFVLHPHSGAGNLTINGNLGISGGGGLDALVVDDTGSTLPINYLFRNLFGAGTTNIDGMGGRGFGAGADIENITINAGNGADTFSINSFKSGSGLQINGGGGGDTVNWGLSNVRTEITNMSSFHYDGQTGSDTFRFNHFGSTNYLNYYRNVGSTKVDSSAGLVYSFTDSNIEVFEINAGSAPDAFFIEGANAGLRTVINAGGGIDSLDLGRAASSVGNIRGPIAYNGGAGGGILTVWDYADTTGDLVHIDQTSIGAKPADTLFGPGGSLTFSDVVDADVVGVWLLLGSGADTVFVEALPAATIIVDGNSPTAAPGDTFRLSLAGVTNPVFTPGSPGNGTYTFGNAADVIYGGFETASAYMPGDYSGNGIVGPEDHTVWRGSFGSAVAPGTAGDGNGDGSVDTADYVIWRKNLGAMLPRGGATFAVSSTDTVATVPDYPIVFPIADPHLSGARMPLHATAEMIGPTFESNATGEHATVASTLRAPRPVAAQLNDNDLLIRSVDLVFEEKDSDLFVFDDDYRLLAVEWRNNIDRGAGLRRMDQLRTTLELLRAEAEALIRSKDHDEAVENDT